MDDARHFNYIDTRWKRFQGTQSDAAGPLFVPEPLQLVVLETNFSVTRETRPILKPETIKQSQNSKLRSRLSWNFEKILVKTSKLKRKETAKYKINIFDNSNPDRTAGENFENSYIVIQQSSA